MIPDQLRLVPVFVMLVNWTDWWHLGWHDATLSTATAYILINLVSAVSLFFMRQYFLTIPRTSRRRRSSTAPGYFKTYLAR